MLHRVCDFLCVSASRRALLSFTCENFPACFKIGGFWENNLCVYFNSPFISLKWQVVLAEVLQTWLLSFI